MRASNAGVEGTNRDRRGIAGYRDGKIMILFKKIENIEKIGYFRYISNTYLNSII